MSAANTPPTPGTNRSTLTLAGAPQAGAGTWTTYDAPRPAYSRTIYVPTAEQLDRDEARRRYLRRNVYAPIIVGVILVIAAVAGVTFLAFGVRTPEARSLITGLSGLTIILLSIPLIVLMSILPIAWLALTIYRRQQRRDKPESGPMAYRSRLQIVLWQLDSLIDRLRMAVERGGYAARRPVIRAHSAGAYVAEFSRGIRRHFTRSN